jgi:hypothetical protein
VRDCIHCTALLYPLINTDLWALTTCVCLCLYLYVCIFYVAYVRTTGNSPYFPLEFIPNFVDIIKPLSNMFKNDHDLTWSGEAKKAFIDIKKALCQGSILIILDYGKDFQLFSFASNYTMVFVLFHKNK